MLCVPLFLSLICTSRPGLISHRSWARRPRCCSPGPRCSAAAGAGTWRGSRRGSVPPDRLGTECSSSPARTLLLLQETHRQHQHRDTYCSDGYKICSSNTLTAGWRHDLKIKVLRYWDPGEPRFLKKRIVFMMIWTKWIWELRPRSNFSFNEKLCDTESLDLQRDTHP